MLEKLKRGSWQTTVAGWAAFLAALGNAVNAQFDADPTTKPMWGLVVTALLIAVGLNQARDNNKRSESVGAK